MITFPNLNLIIYLINIMFEKVLEKILLNYFGEFIQGLDRNNLKLGVWSGNIVIEHV